MLQSIFSADFDIDRLLSFGSSASTSVPSGSQQQPDNKSNDSGLPLDDCYHGDESPEFLEAPQQHLRGLQQPMSQQLELRLIIRGDPCGCVGCSQNGSALGSDLVILTSRYQEPVKADLDIRTAHIILSYMESYLSDKEKLCQEWDEICQSTTIEPKCMADSLTGARPENAWKNRFPGRLLPYDHNRVRLDPAPSPSIAKSDYINASFIRDSQPSARRGSGYSAAGGCILTQGPLEATVNDFWRLVWQSGALAIVNLTRLTTTVDVGKGCEDAEQAIEHLLCAKYWPDKGRKVYGEFEVHLVSEHVWCDEFLIRNLRLKQANSTGAGASQARTVTQFHYLAWEEGGVPDSAPSLLEFRRKVNKSYRGRGAPVIIHCSDGCGRSGAYCLLDTALNRITAGVKEVSLAATLEHLRDQRPGLVATLEQYEFAFTAVAEEVDAVLQSL